MISMSKVKDIREMRRRGHTIAEISRRTDVSEPTVRKYLRQEDFSPRMPVRKVLPSILDPYKPKIDMIALDEFGCIPLDAEGGRLLFQVMPACYERQSMVITTNIEFAKWGTILADEKLASAPVDRVAHYGRLVEFGGESRRVSDSLMLGNSKER